MSFRRLYVTVDQGSASEEFPAALDAALRQELTRRGVTVDTRIVHGLGSDEETVIADVAKWHPDGIMTVNFVGGAPYYGDLGAVDYDVSLLDAASQRRVWRSRVHITRNAYAGPEAMMNEAASCVTKRLEDDGLVARAPR